MSNTTRRDFLKHSATAAAVLSVARPAVAQEQTPRPLTIALMGAGPRGLQIVNALAPIPHIHLKYIADPDSTKAAAGTKSATTRLAPANPNAPAPQPIQDFRQALDDKAVDAIVIAAPDHWHTPGTLLALAAGKHVYVEKPCSHNPREGELLVEAAKKYSNLCIQHGSQRRSFPMMQEAMAKLRAGALGKVRLARGWYANARPAIPKGKPAQPPAHLDWTLWQGPAPEREYRDNLHPYNWHWFWHWGTGECGNNGIHSLDLCRWGLGVTTPQKVTSSGGQYHFKDLWETPDTQFAHFDFGDKAIAWEGRSADPRGLDSGKTFGAAFYGSDASMVIEAGSYTLYEPRGKEISKHPGPTPDSAHFTNFFDAIRSNDSSKLNAPITEGATSVLLCHLANISYRTGQTLHLGADGKPTDNAGAQKLWTREYRPGWEPKV